MSALSPSAYCSGGNKPVYFQHQNFIPILYNHQHWFRVWLLLCCYTSATLCLPLAAAKPLLIDSSAIMAMQGHNPSSKLDAKIQLHTPPLEELASNLENILKKNFKDVKVSVVDCPDLTKPPFLLASSGISGSTKVIDVGGPGNLYPQIKKVLYDLREICKTVESPDCSVLGPGAGPLPLIGFNTELVHNAHVEQTGDRSIFKSYVIYTKQPTSQSPKPYQVKQLTNETANKFLLMSNLYVSDGEPGKVLKISAKKRTGPDNDDNFVTMMRRGLGQVYGSNPVGLGGVFLIKAGRVKMHVMPELPETPFKSKAEIDDWLKYFDMDAPLTCTSVFVSHDPGLDLRVEHSHCFSDHGDGGHYHYDVSRDLIEFEGYYNVAQYLYRIDRVPF